MDAKKQTASNVKPPVTTKAIDLSAKAMSRPPQDPSSLKALFDSNAIKQRLAEVVPKHVTPERLLKVALSSVLKTPALMQCTQQSLVQALIQLGEVGLEPGGGLGLAYLVPYKMKNGTTVAQAIIGYRGYIHLARRSGELESVSARVVHAKDRFNAVFGLNEQLEHVPSEEPDAGKPRLVYCVAKFKDGGHHIEVMTWAEVQKIRQRSKAKDSGPWVTDPEEMAKKTVVRRAQKYWPLASEDMARANEIDDEQVVDGSVAVRQSVQVLPPQQPQLQVVEQQQLEEGVIEEDTPAGMDPNTGEVPMDDNDNAEQERAAVESAQGAGQDVDGVEQVEPTDPVDNLLWRIKRATKEQLPALLKESMLVNKDDPRRAEIGSAVSARKKELV